MNQKRVTYRVDATAGELFKSQLLMYFKEEDYFVMLDSNEIATSDRLALVAIGAREILSSDAGQAFDKLEQFYNASKDWMFGYLGYDLKNELEPLSSLNKDIIGFPDLQFFVPQTVIEINENHLVFHTYNLDKVDIERLIARVSMIKVSYSQTYLAQGKLIATDSKQAYLDKAQNFLYHIHRGDIYEANLCTQFTAIDVDLDPIKAYLDLNDKSRPPFAVFARFQNQYIMSASPERYLKKTGDRLLSQPIKGTAARKLNEEEDYHSKIELLHNQKERSENVMIVDLVRNDLSRVAARGSVIVNELFGLYTFPQVHHMISSIEATLLNDKTGIDAIRATFPMGSMTGAPKISAMKIIEKNESFKRGVYSGAVGYITPQGDFDFNVVIRTLLYDAVKNNVSLSVGSAITSSAIPIKEYQECFVKAAALIEVLENQGIQFN